MNGANEIRTLKAALNTLISQVWTNTGVFLTGFITGNMIATGAVGTTQLAAASVTNTVLAPGALSADTIGRAVMAAGYLTPDKLLAVFRCPVRVDTPGSIPTTAYQAASVTSTVLAAGAVLAVNIGAGVVAQVKVGVYTGLASSASNPGGSPDLPVVVSGLPFAPDAVFLTSGVNLTSGTLNFPNGVGGSIIAIAQNTTSSGQTGSPKFAGAATGLAVKLEATNLSGVLKSDCRKWGSGDGRTVIPYGIEWTSDGFKVHNFFNTDSDATFNQNGMTHTYIAIKFQT